jgi:3-demethoxyubiquinol 3-hydroxylase
MADTPHRSARDALTIKRIVRVNHAGEFGAIRIYSAQIAISARRYPDVTPALTDMLEHEKKHCTAFVSAMPARGRAALCRCGAGAAGCSASSLH